jgi:integration host factor subunit beta
VQCNQKNRSDDTKLPEILDNFCRSKYLKYQSEAAYANHTAKSIHPIVGDIMNKMELIDTLRLEAEVTKSEAAAVVDLFFNKIADALTNDGRVEIRGLCSFHVKKYKAYNGRNPKTGEPTRVKAKKLPFFKCGKELKERVDYR